MRKIFSSKKYSFLKNSLLVIFALAYIFAVVFFHNPNAYAVFNKQINYQGKLTNSSGVAVADGSYNMEFKLYTVDSGGVAVWTETRIEANRVTVTNGLFSVLLGEVSSMSAVDFNQTLYLGVNIGGTTNTPTPTWDGEMSPRKKLGAVAAAFEAINALTATAGFTVSGGNLVSPILVGGSGTTQDLTLQTTTGVGASGADMHFLVGNNGATEAMTILNSGDVGIGISAPQYLFHAQKSGDPGAYLAGTAYRANAFGGGFIFEHARGTSSSPTVILADDHTFAAFGKGYDGNSFENSSAIYFSVDGTPGDADMPGRITFLTSPDGSAAVAERMRIDNAGRVGIGDTSPDYSFEVYDTTNTPVFALSDDDIAHGLTTLAQTDVFSHLSSLSTTTGGAQWTAISDTNAQALSIRGIIGSTDPTDTTPAVKIVGAKSNGSTGVADLGTYETVFQVANNDDAAALSVVGGGFVGIGTTAPAYQLTLSKAADQNIIALDRTSTYSGEDIVGQLSFQYAGDSVANIMVKRDGANDAGKLAFGTQATTAGSMVERMTILANGNVGIGDTSPDYLLDVAGAVGFDGLITAGAGINISNGATSSGVLKILEDSDDGTNFASFQVPALAANTVYVLPNNDGDASQVLTTDGSGNLSWATASGTGANTALSNLAAVAINTSLISDTDNTDALGSATIGWSDLFLGDGGVINWNNGNTTLTQSNEALTITSATNSFLRVQTTGLGNTGGDGLEFSLTPSAAYFWNYENTPLYIGTNDTDGINLFPSGNISTGSASGLTHLDVGGSTRVTGSTTSVLTGSIDPTASTSVTGVGTAFTTELVVGDRITVSGETRTVTAIASDTSLTVDTAFTDNANDTTPDKLPAIFTARDSSNALKFAINDLGQVGIGGVAGLDSDGNPNSSLLNISHTYTDFSGDRLYEPLSMNITVDPSVDTGGSMYGMVQYVQTPTSGVNDFGTMNGLYVSTTHQGSGSLTGGIYAGYTAAYNNSSGNVPYLIGLDVESWAKNSGTTDDMYGVWMGNYLRDTASVTNSYGTYIATTNKAVGTTLTNNYGLYLEDQSGVASAVNYNIYSAGTNSLNYFEGKVNIGEADSSRILTVRKSAAATEVLGSANNPAIYIQNSRGDATDLKAEIQLATVSGGALSAISSVYESYIDVSSFSSALIFSTQASGDSTSSPNITEKMRITGSGNVGIGTATPGYKLDIERSAASSHGEPDIKVGYSWPTYLMSDWPAVGFNLYWDNTASQMKYGKGSTSDYAGLLQLDPNTGSIYFEVTAAAGNADAVATMSTPFLIDRNGNVGIGTTAPEELLEVQGSEANDARIMLDADDGDNTTDSWSIVSDATTNDFQFYNSTTNVAAISSGGNLQIDGTIDVGSFAASDDTSRWVCIDSTGASILQAGVNAASGDCDTSSITVKHAVNDLAIGGIDTLKILRPVSFIYNDDESESVMWGYIAEELDAISPSLAGHNSDGAPRSVQKNAVLAVLTKAAQEINLNMEGIAGTITPLEGSENETFVLAFFENLFTKTTEWLADAGNGIVDLFAKKIHTEQLCLKKSDNSEFCVTGDELDALFANTDITTGGSSATPVSNPDPAADGDTIAPIITLEGDSVISLAIGDTYQELGAAVSDNLEDSIAVIISGSVDTSAEGTYLVAYNATDNSGNTAEEVTRQIIVGNGGSAPAVEEPAVVESPTPDPAPTTEPAPEITATEETAPAPVSEPVAE